MAFGDNQIDGYAEGEEPLVFYHQKGEYRQYEKESQRATAEGRNAPQRGFFKVLVSNTRNRSLFVIMCISFVVVILISLFARNPDEALISNVNVKVKSFAVNERLFCLIDMKYMDSSKKRYLKSDENKNILLSSPVNLTFTIQLLDEDKNVTGEETFDYAFTGSPQKLSYEYEAYDTKSVNLIVKSDEKSYTLKTKVLQ